MMAGLNFLSIKRFSVLFLSLLLMNIGAFSASLIGTPYRIGQDSLNEVQPDVGYNSQDREYLVVWSNDRPGNDDIRAQRVAFDGRLIGNPFYVATGQGHDRRFPAIAYNSKHNQYLVVWEDTTPSGDSAILGRRLAGDGVLIDLTDQVIQGTNANYGYSSPAVIYAYTSDLFLVVWTAWSRPLLGTYIILGITIPPQHGFPMNSSFPISSSVGYPRSQPAVAYNRHANRSMVVWEEKNLTTGLWEVKGHQVTGDGSIWGSELNLGWAGGDNRNPDIAALPTSSTDIKFMVVWEVDPNPSPGSNGTGSAMISETGIIKGSGRVTDSNTLIRSVAVAANENTKTYLDVTWNDGLGGRGWFVIQYDEDGYGLNLSELVPNFSGYNPAISAGPLGDYLIVWQDIRSGQVHTDVFGQLVGTRNYLPLVIH
jgi:hypothetical protein